MSDDRPNEGEYPGQEGLPFGEGSGGPGAGRPPERRRPDPDDDLFVWNELRPPRRDEPRRPAEPVPGEWQVREFGDGAGESGDARGRPDDRARAERDALDRRYEREARGERDERPRRPRQDWRAPEYPTGSGRARYEPADGY